MANKIIIVTYDKSFNFEKNCFNIGGLETYIQDIAHLSISAGYKAIVLSPANTNVVTESNGIEVRGLAVKRSKKENQAICDIAISMIDSDNDRVVVATEQMSVKARHKQVIAIQHGIGWDMPAGYKSEKENINPTISRLWKIFRCERHLYKFNSFINAVCVDYNYINWYRTLDTIRDNVHVWVIPNYASSLIPIETVKEKLENRKDNMRIIFARRFVDYRGARIFMNISKRLLSEFDNVEITFAGSGELQSEIELTFAGNPRVKVTSFDPSESVKFHANFDIAVVPTIFSEGTSLSLCEAMAAGCFPVVTFVGGLSNIILDGYNGLMSYPSEDDFYKKMVKAISLPKDQFDTIVMNAYKSVETSFSIDKWKREWSFVLGFNLGN